MISTETLLMLFDTMKGSVTVKLSADARQSLEVATAEYQTQIQAVAPYLAARGISEEAAVGHRLGYVGHPKIGHEQYTGRLAIPYVTPMGGVVDLRFRSITDDDSPKYLSRPGADSTLYNVGAFDVDTDVIAICEGEMDTIIAHSMCGIPAVGVPGAQGWKNWYARAFADYRQVLVLADGDQQGRDMGKRIASVIDVATVVSMPDGMDVNSTFLAEGPDGVRKRVGL